jgi:hypothetical protein
MVQREVCHPKSLQESEKGQAQRALNLAKKNKCCGGG